MPAPRKLLDECAETAECVIVRHYKERRSKCSVEPLTQDPRFHFVTFKPDSQFDASGLLLLEVGAPTLWPTDRGSPLLILDSTWRYLPAMRRALRGRFPSRSLPSDLLTSYPRVSKLGPEPESGLASIEAVYAAMRRIGKRDDTLLDSYRWRDEFRECCRVAGL